MIAEGRPLLLLLVPIVLLFASGSSKMDLEQPMPVP